MSPFVQEFYQRDTLKVAKDLLGAVLVHETPEATLAGKIVECEAYVGEGDPACHASRGRTPRNGIMYGPPGLAYVYFTYGMHYLLNAVTGPEGFPAAVLIRAVEPLTGLDVMIERRGTDNLKQLTNGPAKLTKAFGIDKAQNGSDLTSGPLAIFQPTGKEQVEVVWTSRIGISQGKEKPWRCFIAGNPYVSKQ